MEGIITIKDSRKQLNDFKEWRNEAIKTVNREKTRYTAMEVCDVARLVVTGVGAVATVVTALSPAPFLAPIVAKSAAALAAGLTVGKFSITHTTEKEKVKKIEARLTDLEGNSKDISIDDVNMLRADEQARINQNTNVQVAPGIQM